MKKYVLSLGVALFALLAWECNGMTDEKMDDAAHIGKGKSFIFIQLADPQLGFNKDKLLEPDIKQLNRAIDIVNREKPPFIICTGDFVHELLNDSAAVAYEECLSRLDSKIKVYNVPGNHDIRELTPEYFDFYQRHYGEDRFSFRYRGCAFIGINSTIIQKGASEMEAEQYAWLDQQLKKYRKSRACFVVSHIPMAHDSMDEVDDYSNFPKEMRTKYMSLFHKYNVRAIFCGHLHRTSCVDADGIEIVTASAVGYPFDEKRGLTVVKVNEDSFEHQYMLLDELER